ncbi:hypothetical protein D3C72_1246540 [compost metagenome]
MIVRFLAGVHSHQHGFVHVDFVRHRVKPFGQQRFHCLDRRLQRVIVVKLIDRVHAEAGRDRAEADLERRNPERLADLLIGVAKLLDHLRVHRLAAEGHERQPIAYHGDFAGVFTGEIRVPVVRQPFSGVVADRAWSRQNAGRLRVVAEELSGRPEDAHVLQRRQIGRRNRRQADQWVERADAAIMDDLRRGYDHWIEAVRELVQVVGVELVEHFAVVGDQGHYAARVEDVQADNDTALISLLENVGIALRQPGQRPVFAELLSGLVVVRLAQYGGERRAVNLRPNAFRVPGLQAKRQLPDVCRDARDAGVERRIVKQRI